MPEVDEFELEKLRAEVMQQQQVNEMLEKSLDELQTTVSELEKRLEGMDEESCEWKTRYEMQTELNQQLEMQALVMSEKIEEAKRTLKDGRFPKTLQMFEETPEVTPQYVKLLERSKHIFESQLRDLEWRLDQESKAYHQANEERKNYIVEINAAKGSIDNFHLRPTGVHHDDLPTETPRVVSNTNKNIPADHRVIDVRRGPIRRTAAVKTLPRID
jgi:chromosome segregation ATPase